MECIYFGSLRLVVVDSPQILSHGIERSGVRDLHIFEKDLLPEVIEVTMVRTRVKGVLLFGFWLAGEFVSGDGWV